MYNTIEWQKIGARTLIRHYLNSERVIELMTDQSRYFHVPIGNMPDDSAIFGSDLFYARHLTRHNHVLWCSVYDYPDLGKNNDDVTNVRLIYNDLYRSDTEIMNVPGWYTNVCIELDVDSLPITAILQSQHINDIEGNNITMSFGGGTATTAATTTIASSNVGSLDELINKNTTIVYDETAQCTEAFRILRTMCTLLMRDISLRKNQFADFQVIHLYRWLRTKKSLLYDPAVLRTVQILMKKLSLQLVAELKNMGCTIVYANFNKIVVCTKRRNVDDALANIDFVVNSIRNKEIFHSLDIGYRYGFKGAMIITAPLSNDSSRSVTGLPWTHFSTIFCIRHLQITL